jgi:acyl-CoA synthetase (NDP forming)
MIQANSNQPENTFWQALFQADSIAVIGARDVPGTWGFDALRAALGAKQVRAERRIYAVNPGAVGNGAVSNGLKTILGVTCYNTILDIAGTVDLAVIVVPSGVVPPVMRQCVQKGVRAAVIISAGFAEVDEAGVKLQAEVVQTAGQGGLRFVGPNCIGHADLHSGVASAAVAGRNGAGPMALLTQSGTLGATIIQIAGSSGIGLSKLVSTGNEASLHMEDYLEYLAGDEDTRIIAVYIEGLREGRRFYNLARDITLKKPIIAIKTGSTGESGRAAKSHTGALAGSDEVYSAAFRQAGVIRVNDEEELCDVAQALLNQPLPRGRRVAILTMGGGFGVVTAEACEKEGLTIASLEADTVEKLNGILPPRWSHGNPVDLVGMKMMGESKTMTACHELLLADPDIDAVISLLPPMMPPPGIGVSYSTEQIKAMQVENQKQLDALAEQVKKYQKPLYLIRRFLPMPGVEAGLPIPLNRPRIPEFPHQHRAARVLRHLAWYREYLEYRKG